VKLVASLICRNELGRYLETCVTSLLEFCDEIAIHDDSSDDRTAEWLHSQYRKGHPIRLATRNTSRFYEHEGLARQYLLGWTLLGKPTHVLAIDADELISDGPALRRLLTQNVAQPVWSLCMEEVWQADESGYRVRCDGGWRPHAVPIVYAVPNQLDSTWRIQDKQLACGREPVAVTRMAHRARPTELDVLHLGWTNAAERAARYARYVEHDAGRFHQRAHLDSIMWEDGRVRLEGRPVPAALAGIWHSVVERANRP
jgi:hypothetical protein